ncbi:uncharacterized protein APUU_50145A [Aspergillus puulaauensis]|uniref:Uncharacterized protein n=1 Tax=Aspergillus puulaauensis TaxID=1220207 RepID=A0A7R8AMV9_9EURO|nr:uncharacterized protein APUU_50145A [Aspergillus puulaauensis]BCS25434.1 hypothetical protein APUU_50145A [Aspergillus puulaauensis]
MWEFLARYAPISLWGGSVPLSSVRLFYSSDFLLLWKENEGDPLILQCILNPEAVGVIRRIRRYVLKDAKEAWRLKESYRDTLAMEAVAFIAYL